MTNIKTPPLPAREHFQRLLHLLELEAEAEKQEIGRNLQRRSPAEAEASGSSLINLVIRDEEIGLGGRILLTLGKRNQNLSLPWTRLRVGVPVILSAESQSNLSAALATVWRGVVSRLYKDAIQIAFSSWDEPDTERPTFRLDRSSDEVVRQRQRQALLDMQNIKTERLKTLRDVLLGHDPPIFRRKVTYKPLNKNLNDSQQAAIRFALTADDLAIIHGPPGTGKTTTVVELIRQLTRQGQTVLACAPSNLAVDNILQHLLAAGEHVIRLGHPARVLPTLQDQTLDLLVENHPDMRVARKLTKDAHTLRQQTAKYSRARPEPGARWAGYQEAKQMLADARRMTDQIRERLLDSTQIVCATTSLDRKQLGGRIFDWCIIDEAGQSTEPEIWIPLQHANCLLLAGDHCQLPPTVISPQAVAAGFNVSMLERLVTQLGPDHACRLLVQYRMHHVIMEFSSQEFYEGTLLAHSTVAQHLLPDLPGVGANDLTSTPIHFIDTAGANYDEVLELDGESRFNDREAELVCRKVQTLLDCGLPPPEIAVITPYAAQVKLLREQFKQSEIEVNTVDGFQGREKEAVVLSLVRSNPDAEIGFLADVRRMNVALTRARRKLIVIGDSATVTNHPFYHRLINYFDSIGAYHSVWEEME